MSSQFQRFRSMDIWIHWQVEKARCKKAVLSSWWPGSRQREQGLEAKVPYKEHGPWRTSPRKTLHLKRQSVSLWTHQWLQWLMRFELSRSCHLSGHAPRNTVALRTQFLRCQSSGDISCVNPGQLPAFTCRPPVILTYSPVLDNHRAYFCNKIFLFMFSNMWNKTKMFRTQICSMFVSISSCKKKKNFFFISFLFFFSKHGFSV